MCEFKFCRGNGTCFLSESSPCPGKRPQSRVGESAVAADRAGLSYKGFLERDFVLAALCDEAPAAETPRGLPQPSFVRGALRDVRYRVA